MTLATVENVRVESIVSCVPATRKDNLNDANIPTEQGQKVVDTTGIRYRRVVTDETAADLCLAAAEDLFAHTETDRDNVAVVVFVTQTPDYILPTTATIIQDKLGLPQSTIAFDISLGCSGYVYGLSVISTLLEKMPNPNATALLMVGDTVSKICHPQDMSTYPLFGDAGSATLLKKHEGSQLTFDLYSDGKGANAIKVEDGGFRNPYSPESEVATETDGNTRRKKDLYLNGMDVFSFGISKVPKAVKAFYEAAEITQDDVDFFVFHQANKMMNEKIRKKLKLPEEKVPYTLYDYANVSCTTIPITISSRLQDKMDTSRNIIACGFGVGLSWGTVNFELPESVYLNTVEI